MMIPIPITKAKKNLPVDTDWFNEDVYAFIFAEGLKTILNKGMGGDAYRTKDVEGDELEKTQAACFAKAEETLANLREGNVKKRKAGKESREVTTEARRLAREAVKAAFREAGKKTTGIKASVITAMADELITEDASYIERARKNVAKMKERETITVAPKEGSSLASLIATAEDAKPKVAPTRKKATTEQVVAAKATSKSGKGKHATAH